MKPARAANFLWVGCELKLRAYRYYGYRAADFIGHSVFL
jgi:hypothetical protein